MSTPFASDLVTKVKDIVYTKPTKNRYGGYSNYVNKNSQGIDNVKFQTTPLVFTVEGEKAFVCRAPFGISDPRDDARDPTRLNLQLTPEDPGLRAFLDAFDEATITAATAQSAQWFKKAKPLSREVIESMYKRLIPLELSYPKDEHGNPDMTKEPYTPSFRVKVNLAGERATEFLMAKPMVDKVTGDPVLNENGEQRYVFKRIKSADARKRIPKQSRVVAVCTVKGLWFMSKEFGTNIDATQVIVYPSSQQEAPAPNLGGNEMVIDDDSGDDGDDADNADDVNPREEAADYAATSESGHLGDLGVGDCVHDTDMDAV